MTSRIFILSASLAVAAATPFAAHAAPAGTYNFDESHTFVTFTIGRANAASAHGMVSGGTGNFVYNPAKPSAMKVNFEIPVEAIFTGHKKRDGHLKGPDFFNAKQFPKAVFKTKSVTVSGDTFTVKGSLTMHGKTHAETITLKKVGEGKNQEGKDYVSFEGGLKINRKEYGITYLDGYLSDDVEIMISADGLK